MYIEPEDYSPDEDSYQEYLESRYPSDDVALRYITSDEDYLDDEQEPSFISFNYNLDDSSRPYTYSLNEEELEDLYRIDKMLIPKLRTPISGKQEKTGKESKTTKKKTQTNLLESL